MIIPGIISRGSVNNSTDGLASEKLKGRAWVLAVWWVRVLSAVFKTFLKHLKQDSYWLTDQNFK